MNINATHQLLKFRTKCDNRLSGISQMGKQMAKQNFSQVAKQISYIAVTFHEPQWKFGVIWEKQDREKQQEKTQTILHGLCLDRMLVSPCKTFGDYSLWF